MDATQDSSAYLPIKRNLTPLYVLSLIIVVFMAAASVVGILNHDSIYPSESLSQTFLPNDVITIIIGVPILLGSVWLAQRGKLLGLLLWPGALFSVLYTSTIYMFTLPLNVVFLLHLGLVPASMYTLIGLLISIEEKTVQRRISWAVSERLTGGILVALGALSLLRVVAVLLDALIHQIAITEVDLVLHITDFVFSPAMLIGGTILWRRTAFGYVTGLGLLFQASMLFFGLVIFLLLQPLLTAAPFVLTDVLVVIVMGLVCFIPFARLVRAIVSETPGASTQSQVVRWWR
jgi:uncharacterized membrane protein